MIQKLGKSVKRMDWSLIVKFHGFVKEIKLPGKAGQFLYHEMGMCYLTKWGRKAHEFGRMSFG